MNEEEIIEEAEKLIDNCDCWLDDDGTDEAESEYYSKAKETIQSALNLYHQEKEKNKKLEDEAILLRMTHDYDVKMIDEVKGESVELFKTIDMMAEDLLDDSMRSSFWIMKGIKDKQQVKRYYWDKLENKK